MPKTSSKKFRQKLKEMKEWLYCNKEQKLGKLMYMLNIKLIGHYRYFRKYKDRAFVYFDPPYYNKGKLLYKNFFTHENHLEIFEIISSMKIPWILTYDNVDEIKKIYHGFNGYLFDLNYSVANSGKNSELLYLSENLRIPYNNTQNKMINIRKINTNAVPN